MEYGAFLSWDVNCAMESQLTLNSHLIFPSLKNVERSGKVMNAAADYGRLS